MKESYEEDLASHFGLSLYSDAGLNLGLASTGRVRAVSEASPCRATWFSVCSPRRNERKSSGLPSVRETFVFDTE